MHQEKIIQNRSGCSVVAEVGSNHNGCWETALEMLKRISAAKVDAVKFQYYRADRLYPKGTGVAEYLVGKGGIEKSTNILDLLRKSEIPEEWLDEISGQCRALNLDLIMSVFDVESVNVLARHGIKTIKVASSEITHFPLLKAVGETRLPVILSTGVSNLGRIEKAIEYIGHDNIILLHCTATYPVPDSESNLRVIDTLRHAFGLPVGLSDHTDGTLASIIAVAFGAVMIEKHVTLDKNMDGPDHEFSVTPAELADLVGIVRRTGIVLGDARKKITENESELIGFTPGLFARYDIPEGAVINEECLDILRRNREGIGTELTSVVIGRTAKKKIPKGAPITWNTI